MKELDTAHGIVLFTFDDRHFEEWIAALPLFEKYRAHVTFFVFGEIDREAICAMRTLRAAGHTVGLHTVRHADAPPYFEEHGAAAYCEHELLPQLEPCREAGLEIRSFSYPNNRRSEETDRVLGAYFTRFRAGKANADESQIFVPVDALADTRVMRGFGIGEYYNTTREALSEIFRRVAETNTCVTFFSHNICPDAKFVDVPTDLLEFCLSECARLGIRMMGFDELPMPKGEDQ